MNTRTKSTFFYFSLFISTMLLAAFPSQAQAQSPILLIHNCQDLQNIGAGNNSSMGIFESLNGNYILGNDVNCSGVIFNPIGSSVAPFQGNLDGQGHSIKYLRITGGSFSGLFAVINNGQVTNLNIMSAAITGPDSSSVGILAGSIEGNSKISQVTVQGTVTGGKQSVVGGIAGSNSFGTIFQSSADVIVNGDFSGGLVGYNSSGTIDQSFSTGKVTGMTYVGGLASVHQDIQTPGVIQDSYSKAIVILTNGSSALPANYDMAGGLVGFDSSKIINSYAAGLVATVNPPVNYLLGGVFGNTNAHSSSVSFSNVYWDTQATDQSGYMAPGVTGLPTSQMYLQLNYANWDFTNTWIGDNQHYPALIWQETPTIDLWNSFSAVSQANLFESFSPPNTINWSNIDNISNISVKWSDLLTLSKPLVWSYQTAITASGALNSVNWNSLKNLGDSNINWSDIVLMSNSNINWGSLNPLVKSGANWTDWARSTTSGINWNDIFIASRAGVNWRDISIDEKVGTNWANWAQMTKSGINWPDLSILSNQGINWNNVSISDDSINLSDLAWMTKEGIDWKKVSTLSRGNVNWDSAAILNKVPMSFTDLHTLKTMGVNNDGNSSQAFAFPKVLLTVHIVGNGVGFFASTPDGLQCDYPLSNDCTGSFRLNQLILLDFISSGSSVTNWGGCTPMNANTCTLMLNQNTVLDITATVTPLAQDGDVLNAGSGGSLLTSFGPWSFSQNMVNGNNYILLNGNNIGGGFGILLLVYNKGQVYAKSKVGGWYHFNGAGWDGLSADPRVPQVGWQKMIGVTVLGSTLTKRAVTGWGNAGSVCIKQISNSGLVQFQSSTVPGNSASMVMAGFINAGTAFSNSYTGFNYSIMLKYNQQEIHEGPNVVYTLNSIYNATDVFSVVRSGSTISYTKNGVTFYTSKTPASGILVAAAAMYDTLGTLTNTVVSGS